MRGRVTGERLGAPTRAGWRKAIIAASLITIIACIAGVGAMVSLTGGASEFLLAAPPIGARIAPTGEALAMADPSSNKGTCTILPGAEATHLGTRAWDGFARVRVDKASGTCPQGAEVYVFTPLRSGGLSKVRFWKRVDE